MQRKPKRSSILKPSKQSVRAPLQDLDSLQLEEDDGNATQPSSRRVSFSRISQIKEFDPTIGYMTHWNQSYEETLDIVENDENQPKSSNGVDDIMQLHSFKLINRKRRSSKFQLSVHSAGTETVGNVCFDSEQHIHQIMDGKILPKQPRTSVNCSKEIDAVKGDMSMFCEDLDVTISRGDKSFCSNKTDDFYDTMLREDSIIEQPDGHDLKMEDWSPLEPIPLSSSDSARKTSVSENSNSQTEALCKVDSNRRKLQTFSSFQNQREKNSDMDMDVTLAVGGIQDSEEFNSEIPNMDMAVSLGKVKLIKSRIQLNKSIDDQENVANACTKYDSVVKEKGSISKDQPPNVKATEKRKKNSTCLTSSYLCKTQDNDVDMDITFTGGRIQVYEGGSVRLDDSQEDHLNEVVSESLDFTVPLGNLELQNAEASNINDSISTKLNALGINNSSVCDDESKEGRVVSSIIKTGQCDAAKTAEVDISCNKLPSESLGPAEKQQDNLLAPGTDSKENVAPIFDIRKKPLTGKGTKRLADAEVDYAVADGLASCSNYERNDCNNQIYREEDESFQCMEFTVPLGKLKIQKLEGPLQTVFPESVEPKDVTITIRSNQMENLSLASEYGKKHSMTKTKERFADSHMEFTVAGGAIQVNDSYFDDRKCINPKSQIFQLESEIRSASEGMEFTVPLGKLILQESEKEFQKECTSETEVIQVEKSQRDNNHGQHFQLDDETVQYAEGMEFTVPVGKLLHQKLEKTIQEETSLSTEENKQCSSITMCNEQRENTKTLLLDHNVQSFIEPDINNIFTVGPIQDDNIHCDSNEGINKTNQTLQQKDEVASGTTDMEFTVPLGKLLHQNLDEPIQKGDSFNVGKSQQVASITSEIEERENYTISNLGGNEQLLMYKNDNTTEKPEIEIMVDREDFVDNHIYHDGKEVSQVNQILEQEDDIFPEFDGMELTVPLGKIINQKSETNSHKVLHGGMNSKIGVQKDIVFINVENTPVLGCNEKHFISSCDKGNVGSEMKSSLAGGQTESKKSCDDSESFNCIKKKKAKEETFIAIGMMTNSNVQILTAVIPPDRLKYQNSKNDLKFPVSSVPVPSLHDVSVCIHSDLQESAPTSILPPTNQKHVLGNDKIRVIPNVEDVVNKEAMKVSHSHCNVGESISLTECTFEQDEKTLPDTGSMEFTIPIGKLMHGNLEKFAPEAVGDPFMVNRNRCDVFQLSQINEDQQQDDKTLPDDEGMELTVPLGKLMHQESESVVQKVLTESLHSNVTEKADIKFNTESILKERIMTVLENSISSTIGISDNPEIEHASAGSQSRVNYSSFDTSKIQGCQKEGETVPGADGIELTAPCGELKLQNVAGPLKKVISNSSDMIAQQNDRTITKGSDSAEYIPCILDNSKEHLISQDNEVHVSTEKDCRVGVGAMEVDNSCCYSSEATELASLELKPRKLEGSLQKIIHEPLAILESQATNKEDNGSIEKVSCTKLNHTDQQCLSENGESLFNPDMEYMMVDGETQDKPLPNCNDESVNPVEKNSQKEKVMFQVTEDIESSKFQAFTEPVLLNGSKSENFQGPVQEETLEHLNKVLNPQNVSFIKNTELQESAPLSTMIPNKENLLSNDESLVNPDTLAAKTIQDNDICFNVSGNISQANQIFQPEDVPVPGNEGTEMSTSLRDFPMDLTIRTEDKCQLNCNQNFNALSITVSKASRNKRENPFDCTLPSCKKGAAEEQISTISDHENEDKIKPNQMVQSNSDEKYDEEKEKEMDDAEDDETSCDSSSENHMVAAGSQRILEKSDSCTGGDDSVMSISKSLSERSSSAFSPKEAKEPRIIEEWIKEEADKKSCPWRIHKLSDNEWSFLLFYKSVKLTLVLEPNEEDLMSRNKTRVVENVLLKSCLIEGNRDCDYVVHRVFLQRCPQNILNKICPSTAQIPELFLFLNSEIENINVLLKQATRLDKCYPVIFKDDSFIFSVNSMKLLKLFYVKVKLANWQNGCIKPEDVTITNCIGRTRESDIQEVVALIKKDENFLPCLYDTMLEYMEQLEELED